MTKEFSFNSEKYSKFVGQLLFMKMKLREIIAIVNFTLSFNKGPNCFGMVQIFSPGQKFIHILGQSQTFCARLKNDLHSV